MKKLLQLLGATAIVVSSINPVHAQAFTEGFEDITTLTSQGWYMQNNSTAIGSTTWFQGNTTVFAAQSGTATSYIGANFNSTTGNSTISTWLLTPNRTFKNGDTFTFYTRCSPDNMYADRLEVRMSTNGASTDVGTGPTAVGDFTTELLTINPNLQTSVYPYASWGFFTITISGLSQPTSGRIAFRYHVTNGGPSGVYSDYIGIDNVVYTPYTCPQISLNNTGALTDGTAGTAYNQQLSSTGTLGNTTYSITAGSLPNGLTLDANGSITGIPTQTGTFNYSVSVLDASGCNGAGNYSITVNCPSNPIAFGNFPSFCSSNENYTLVEATPTGGTYSGANISNGVLNLIAGTQDVIYSYTDAYGCIHGDTSQVLIAATPNVTFPALSTACVYHDPILLTTATPVGGTYSGPGMTNGTFYPAQAGTGVHTITYTYAENGCTATAEATMTVDGCLSVKEVNGNAITIFPNPARESITIQVNDESAELANISLIAADGKVVKAIEQTTLSNGQQILDISDLAPGIYTIQVERKSTKYVERIQVQ